jgi:23S rRNA (pseudouridine1915-N3)-methyltransferase
MLKVKLFLIGKTSYDFLKFGEAEYAKRLVHYCSFDRIDFPDIKNGKSLSIEVLKKKESQQFLKKIEPTDYLILLDEKGETKTSIQFSQWISERSMSANQSLVFVVGGAYGFDEEIYMRANAKLSLSKMTYSHQMVRMIFLEQLYRAFTILKGEPYHHE